MKDFLGTFEFTRDNSAGYCPPLEATNSPPWTDLLNSGSGEVWRPDDWSTDLELGHQDGHVWTIIVIHKESLMLQFAWQAELMESEVAVVKTQLIGEEQQRQERTRSIPII